MMPLAWHQAQQAHIITVVKHDYLSIMATHSSILAWKTHGQGNLVDCSPWGRRVGHD